MFRRRWATGGAAAVLVVVVIAVAAWAVGGCTSQATVHVSRNLTVSARGQDLHADAYSTGALPGPGAGTAGTGSSSPGSGTARPAIVMIHGGAWTTGSKDDLADLARNFARAGFVAVSVDYDLAGPDRFPHQVEDCQAWVRYVQQHAAELGVDPHRVGVFGVSAGGNLAMLVGTGGSGDPSLPPVRAVSSWSGIADLTVLAPPDGKSHPANPPAGCMGQSLCIGISSPGAFTDFVGCTLAQCPKRYAAASPVNGVTASTPPMYLTAAQTDFVPFDQCQRMAAALQAKNVTAQAVAVAGTGHADTIESHALSPTIDFFRHQLS